MNITEQFTKDNIKTDSRDVRKGDIFFAIKGADRDGHDHVIEALDKGASSVLCERIPDGLTMGDERIVVVPDTREALALAAKDVFGDPSSSIDVSGVTGTNGKTTTVFLIDSILRAAHKKSGFISTVFNKTSGDSLLTSNMTTPDVMTINRLLSDMALNGKQSAVMEISSHGLAQKRVFGIGLVSAVFTNITPEHLDYHGTMDNYLKDKSCIFSCLKPDGYAVLNFDDPLVADLKDSIGCSNIITFGLSEGADVRAENIRLSSEGSEFDLLASNRGSISVNSSLIGAHNIYNALAACAALLNTDISLEQFRNGIETAVFVPGRSEPVISDAPFKVFVDYAHTPDALKNILQSMRSLSGGRLICVFGCGGDRDKSKRPVMGQVASELCDSVILTSDNPRSEDPMTIISQIEKGIAGKNDYCIIENRYDAIKAAIEEAGKGDIIVIAGKGHEDHQILGDNVIHFDDRQAARELLKSAGY